MQYVSISPEVIEKISSLSLSSKKISWSSIERICYSFEDILVVVERSISLGISIVGIPNDKVMKFLKEKEIDFRSLQ